MGLTERYPSQEVAEEAAKFGFEQKLHAQNIDTRALGMIGQAIEHYRAQVRQNFSPEGQAGIDETLLAMLNLHKDQKDRPGGVPYISHPLEVSRRIVEDFGCKDIDIVRGSLLHDSVEDQAMKLARPALCAKYSAEQLDAPSFLAQYQEEIKEAALAEIASKYGDRIATVLGKLTNPDFDAMASQEVNPEDKGAFRAKKNDLYKEHVESSINDPDVLMIKLADFMHNISDTSKMTESPLKGYFRDKYLPVIDVFVSRLGREDATRLFSNKDDIISQLTSIKKNLME